MQKELLKQTVEPRQALELAINMELGMGNQHQIQQHNNIVVPANVNAVQFNNNSRKPYWQNNTTSQNKIIDQHSIVPIMAEFGHQIIVKDALLKGKRAIIADY